MLDMLRKGFEKANHTLRGKQRLTPEALAPALKEIRDALIQADVRLDVAKAFIEKVEARLTGEVVQLRDTTGQLRNLTPADYFASACHDELVELMGPSEPSLDLSGNPTVIMMVGLQGSGKTTTTGKLAKRLLDQGKKPMLVACDIYRPAAVDQLMVLGRKLNVPVFSIKGMQPVELAKMGVAQARSVGRDVVILDTAGRLAIDNALMDELVQMKAAVTPNEVLFVCDAMIGQDAVTTAKEFDRLLDFTGFVLTKMDGDARGGAALSIKAVTGKPVKLVGEGEELERLDTFRPEGLAQRILGLGDVAKLVNTFEKHVKVEDAEKSATKMMQGQFSYEDFLEQIQMLRKMGPLKDILKMLPGMSGLLDKLPAEAIDEDELARTVVIIQSMTKQERQQPDLLNSSRFRRIAKGCGRTEADVRSLHERFVSMRKMMKQMFGGGMGDMMKMMGGGGFPGGGGGFPGMGGGGFPGMGGGGFPGMGGGGFPGMGGGGFPGLGGPTQAPQRKLTASEIEAKKQKRKDAKKSRQKNR